MKRTDRLIKLHRELWDWLYHHPSKGKQNWPEWKRNGGKIKEAKNLCFLCEGPSKVLHEHCCILDWYPFRSCMSKGSPYYRSWNATSPRTRKKYAKIIRDLPKTKKSTELYGMLRI